MKVWGFGRAGSQGSGGGGARRSPGLGAVSRGHRMRGMAGVAGLEPVTSAVTGQRSNQLSYTPAKSAGAFSTRVIEGVNPFLMFSEEKRSSGCRRQGGGGGGPR